jgi:FkbM family methyltransferase
MGTRTARSGPFEMSFNLGDDVQRLLYWTGRYDSASQRHLRPLLRPHDTVVDVGANVGAFAIPVSDHLERIGGGSVVAVEPYGPSYRTLERQVLGRRITLRNVALGKTTGTLALRAPRDGAVGELSAHVEGPVVAQVPMRRADELLAEAGISRVDVLKIDVEGHELEVLEGFGDLREGIRVAVVEVQPELQVAAGHGATDLPDWFEKNGFALRWVRYSRLESHQSDVPRAGNLLALRC